MFVEVRLELFGLLKRDTALVLEVLRHFARQVEYRPFSLDDHTLSQLLRMGPQTLEGHLRKLASAGFVFVQEDTAAVQPRKQYTYNEKAVADAVVNAERERVAAKVAKEQKKSLPPEPTAARAFLEPGGTASLPSEDAMSAARKLCDDLQSQGLLVARPSLQKWAAEFDKLLKAVPAHQVSSVLVWYTQNLKLRFMPQALCAASFVRKFPQIMLLKQKEEGAEGTLAEQIARKQGGKK